VLVASLLNAICRAAQTRLCRTDACFMQWSSSYFFQEGRSRGVWTSVLDRRGISCMELRDGRSRSCMELQDGRGRSYMDLRYARGGSSWTSKMEEVASVPLYEMSACSLWSSRITCTCTCC
jgi:hypothetical protein